MECSNLGCALKADDWQVCAQCFKKMYCSQECLESDWCSIHGSECEGHTFKFSDFRLCSSLLSLPYSQLKLYKHTATNTLYTIKSIKKSLLSSILPLDSLLREIAIHKSLSHDHIIKLYDQLEDSSKIYFVLEHAGNTTLSDHIKKKKFLSESQAAKILVELCMALKYMHSKKVIHRDLKPENILLTDQGNVKICDMGWSTFIDKPRKTYCGSLDFMAPEVFLGAEYSFSADVWSLGVVLFSMLSGKNPFLTCTEEEKIEKIRKKDYGIDVKLSKACKDLIQKMLTESPERRIKLEDVLKHRWIQENFFFECEIEAGAQIFHWEFGSGLVSFVKGMMCFVEFRGFSMDFVILELDKNCKVVKDKYGRVSEAWKLENGGSLGCDKAWGKLLEIDVNDSFVLDHSKVPDSPLTVAKKKDELNQLQTILEKPYVRSRKYTKSLIDSIF